MPRGVRLARNPYYSYLFLPGSVVTCQSTRAYPGILSTFFFLSTQPLTSPVCTGFECHCLLSQSLVWSLRDKGHERGATCLNGF
ncbi:hypothetical protein COCSADRAFT_322039 [Bipolaris sorokiniana ND90Pr]|uniref:Uncharacterized protein n=1 Tax=Cochliobolus sativus (strain ND90Pr / ATCC 201652) TaxID=665912 RepID=M2SA38_COCSN|nr:uncharacterized protein COCSADRAFT_322039 [Bipolaris sorokiniana ND90Pr]EMD64168.1 hypothetical protein COCSADRAFT_322039 [Bipolaris sorokiniana ND90Pr]